MLQFFKKSGQREKPRSSSDSLSNSKASCKSVENVCQQQPGPLCSLEKEEEDESCGDHNSEVTAIRSRLSKTLPEILSDKGALGYFFQFLEARGAVALIKFWLEVECVCGSCGVKKYRTGSDESLHGGGDRSREGEKREDKHSPESADSNDNYRCNIPRRSESVENHVHRKKDKSNCDEAPKTSQVVNRAEESNVDAAKQDATRIYKRYIVKEALGPGRVPEDLLGRMESALLSQDVGPLLRCLNDVQRIVYKILEDEHIDDFLRSDFHCKHQIDVLTSGNVQLADILHNETAFFHFIEFMEIEGKRELLDFWMSAVNYRQNLLSKGDAANPMEAQTDALILYDKYFSLQATMPLGFSDKIRFQVEQNICREDGEGPRPDCFDRPCQIVYTFLKKHYLAAFLSSQLYYRYLSELISTIQSSPCPALHPRLRRTGSDCSSEISTASVSTQNTTATGNDENSRRQGKPNRNGNMSIDTRQLYDPDSLWRRQKYNLSVGYVNDMGRFVTEIDPDPHRKYGESRLSRAMKRLVNMENDKAKEEMAWKIAEMIVREITSLTLGVTRSHP